ncbi:S1 RNA-binding domain-containing protein [Ruminococcus sp.]|uniref:S1 RNA-binding domain-containing protein n=1 Tax=Ruminococcus sp. TaxID=41978 RepID=UPI00386961D8
MALSVGEIVNGKVTGITNFGAFVETEDGSRGMIHISEISRSYIEDIKSVLKIGQAVTVKVISVADDGKVALSMKQLEKADASKKPAAKGKPRTRAPQKQRKKYEPAPPVTSPGDFEWQSSSSGGSFEDMMSKFKRTSEDKMSDLKRGESRGYSRRGNGGGRK